MFESDRPARICWISFAVTTLTISLPGHSRDAIALHDVDLESRLRKSGQARSKIAGDPSRSEVFIRIAVTSSYNYGGSRQDRISKMSRVQWILVVFGILEACGQRDDSARLRETELRMKQRCAEAGLLARREWVTRYHGETFSDSPEYVYNEQLNTCLYADEYSDSGVGGAGAAFVAAKSRRDRFVLDVFANRILAEYTEHDGRSITTKPDAVMCQTEDEFIARKAKLFGR